MCNDYENCIIRNILRHNKQDEIITSKVLKAYLYYSLTKQSCIQRNYNFDNSLIVNTKMNKYIEYYIINLFGLEKIEYENVVVNNDVLNENNYCAYIGKKGSLYKKFIEGIRNSLAHGGFIINNNSMKSIFISMYSKNGNEYINFFLSCGCVKINDKLLKLATVFNNILKDRNSIRYEALKNKLSLKIKNNYYFSKKMNKYLIFVNNDDEKQVKRETILNYINSYKIDEKRLFVFSKIGKININKLLANYNNVEILKEEDFLSNIRDL